MKKIPFRIVGIEAERFTLKEGVKIDSRVDVQTNFGFAVNSKRKLVKCSVSYVYGLERVSIMEMVLSCVFAVDPAAFSDMLKGDKFIIEPFFSQYLATINVGAARGEIHARCEQANSEIAQVILPPINLVEVLSEPVVIEL